jgi:transaldolase/glucose-6-phosphate isomerase
LNLLSTEKERSVSALKASLPDSLAAKVKATSADWQSGGKMQRLWQRDATLWSGADEASWLGWLDIVEEQVAHQDQLQKLAKEIQARGFQHILLLGMGGSSLCPEVLRMTFGRITHFPTLHVLDSTDPAQVKFFEHQIDIPKTLFIVSSKSGSTLEPNIFKQYFFERTRQAVGAVKVGSHFIAITDPGSKMQQVAEADRFLHIFFGRPSIGGRYSALSNFGMVPAAVMGVDTKTFLARAAAMVQSCGPTVAVDNNPGAALGMILGTAAVNGRDKVTILTSPGISDLGAWLEQLLAESTGKIGKGIIPVDREHLGTPDVYGNDRVFVYVRLESAPDTDQDFKIDAIEKAGHPVVRIAMADTYELGAEFFRWEIATAVAGAIIGINAFNQPDVEASKIATKTLTSEYEAKGSLPAEKPVVEDSGIKLFTDEINATELATAARGDNTLAGYLKAHLARIKPGDYFAVLGYIQMNAEHEQTLQAIRHAVRDKKGVATVLGFGPRFLHSTGQAYKGGPNSGVFLQITCDDSVELPVPGQKFTFGVVKAAQARGDFQVLAERGRRALRVHLGSNLKAGLAALLTAVQKAI